MTYKTLTTSKEIYSAPATEVLEISQEEILCVSKKGSTEDFELEDFEM